MSFGTRLEEFVEKLIRNFRKTEKRFPGNLEKLRRQKLEIVCKF